MVTFQPVEGFYKDNFLPVPPGDKDLFQFYVRGDTYETKGNTRVRTDLLTFDGKVNVI